MKSLKDWCTQCRTCALQGTRPQQLRNLLTDSLAGVLRRVRNSHHGLVALSMIGRALPEGCEKECAQSLTKHREALLTPFTTNEALLASVRKFSETWASQHLKLSEFDPLGTHFSSGSCLSHNRREGGNLCEWLEQQQYQFEERDPIPPEMREMFGIASVDEMRQTYGLGPMDDLGLHYCYGCSATQREHPSGETEALEELSAVLERDYEDLDLVQLYQTTDVRERLARFDADWHECRGYTGAGKKLPGEVVVTAERGAKSRIVSKHVAASTRLGHRTRVPLFKGLKRDPRVAGVIIGDAWQAAEKVFKQSQPPTEPHDVVSSDLTSASDLMPLDLCSEMAEGVLAGLGTDVPEWIKWTLREATDAQQLTWPAFQKTVRRNGKSRKVNLTEFHEGETQRGILMGKPCTWFFLCLYHLWLIDEATSGDPLYRYARAQAAVCGDDLVAYWPQPVVERYHRLLERTGAKISLKKHFVFPDAGVFTEKCFKVNFRSREMKYQEARQRGLIDLSRSSKLPRFSAPCGVTWFKQPSLKGLVCPSGNNPAPRWKTLGSTVESLSDKYGRATLMRIVEVLYPGVTRWFQRVGLPSLPRQLGGSGLYRGDPKIVNAGHRAARAAKIAVFGKAHQYDRDVFMAPWADRPSKLEDEGFVERSLSYRLENVHFCRPTKSLSKAGLERWCRIGEARQLLRNEAVLTAQIYHQRCIMGDLALKVNVQATGLARFTRDMERTRDGLIKRWPGVKEVSKEWRVSHALKKLQCDHSWVAYCRPEFRPATAATLLPFVRHVLDMPGMKEHYQ